MQMVFPSIHKEVRVKEEEMARFSCLPSAFLLLLAFAFVAEIICGANAVAYQPTGGEGSVPAKECPSKCAYRCSETSHKKPCMFFCIKCCTKCLCVPSGTYGHKEECPCYNNWKTKEGKPKCP